MDKNKKKIELKELEDKEVCKWETMARKAKSTHRQRVEQHHFYSDVAHMKNLYDEEEVIFSEGSTQSIKRKIMAQTLQRIPDGELITQYNKNSIESAQIDYLFKNKILTSEIAGKDRLKDLWRTFSNSYIYGFGCVRTGFDCDYNGDIVVTYTNIPYDMVYPSPDCDYIEEADWYVIDEMIARSYLKSLLNDKGKLRDTKGGWEQKTIDYILQEKVHTGEDADTKHRMQDDNKGITKTESIKVRTVYKKNADEFITYVPELKAKLRTVKNYDPRKDVPIHFMVLEPDPEFPLGCSSVLWTLSQQQIADTFQSTVYNTLELSLHPPLVAFGDITEEDILMEKDAYWNLGTNPNNKIEKFPVETTTLTQFGSILEQIASSMGRNMNIQDGTVASDAHVPGWSKTPQGVEAQTEDKTITINQYQKRVETFFSEWANHALRSYLASMSGEQELTVDEETRRKVADIEETINKERSKNNEAPIKSIIKDNKVKFNFTDLSADRLDFQVRTGSLIQNRKETERQNIQELIVPVSQCIGALSDANKPAFEQNLMQLIQRLFELSDIDFAQTAGQRIDDRLMVEGLRSMATQIIDQNKSIEQLQQIAMGSLPQEQQQMMQEAVPAMQQQAGTSQLPPEAMNQIMAQQQAQQQVEPQPQAEELPPELPEV